LKYPFLIGTMITSLLRMNLIATKPGIMVMKLT